MEKIKEEITGGEILTEDKDLFSSVGNFFDYVQKAGSKTKKIKKQEFTDTLPIRFSIEIREILEPAVTHEGKTKGSSECKEIVCRVELPFEHGPISGKIELVCWPKTEADIQSEVLKLIGREVAYRQFKATE